MGFFARPDLSDIQFVQSSGSTLSLSGQTRIGSTSGLTLSDGNNGDVVITASGATSGTTGHVLTFDGGAIKLLPSSISGDIPFACGTEDIRRCPYEGLNVNSNTVSGFLEGFFFPDAPPTSSMSVLNTSTSKQYGDTSGIGTCNLSWSVTECTNPFSVICADVNGDGAYDCDIPVTGGNQSGLLTYTYSSLCGNPIIPPPPSTNVSFTICAETVSGETTTGVATITWEDTEYWGGNATNYIGQSDPTINSGVDNLCASALASTGNRCFCNFDIGDNNFFYYAYPTIFGVPQQITVNGLPNNSWGCDLINTLDTFSRCNTDGYCQDFYLVRSDNQISGAFNINITTVC